MIESYQIALVPDDAEPAGARVRVMPWGQVIDHQGQQITYDHGALTVPDHVPVSIDHGDGVLQRIGVLERSASTDDGLYGDLKISDTTTGRDVRTLLVDGVVTDVSAGVAVDRSKDHNEAGVIHRHGTLDHIAIVTRGAFSGSDGARVLAAYQEGPPMTSSNTYTISGNGTGDPVEPAVKTADFERLERQVAALSVPAPNSAPSRPGNFHSLHDFYMTQIAAARGERSAVQRLDTYAKEIQEIELYALDNDTTTTAAGVVPDYLSNSIISLINTRRPLIESVLADPAGSYGMSVVYPEVTTKPTVANQAAEKTEVDSTAMAITATPVPLLTYAGASDVSLQLIERSQPSFLDLLFRELAGAYAQRTELVAGTALAAGAGATAILANLGADGAATWAAIAGAAGDVVAGVGMPPDTLWLSADRWTQLMSLADTEGRPLVVPLGNGPANAQGVGGLNRFEFSFGGLRVVTSPSAPTGLCVVGWSGGMATIETRPQQLRALQVNLLGMNCGVWGLFAAIVKYPDAFSKLTLA